MRYGLSAMQNKRVSPKISKVNSVMAMYGHLQLLTQIPKYKEIPKKENEAMSINMIDDEENTYY